jgi:hypothetical protein
MLPPSSGLKCGGPDICFVISRSYYKDGHETHGKERNPNLAMEGHNGLSALATINQCVPYYVCSL